MDYLNKAIHKDLLFFHDQRGIQTKAGFLDNTKNNICANPNQKPIRKVEENSLDVFPLYNDGKLYGAIQSGIHNFYIRERNKEDIHTSRAKFTHVWLLENGKWLLKEVLSFDHNDPGKSVTHDHFDNEIKDLLIKEKVPVLGLGVIENGSLKKIQDVKNYDSDGKAFETVKYYEANAAANLLTTVEDYGNFLTYILNGADLSKSVFDEMIKNQVQLNENDYFGLGWEKLTGFSGDEYALMHTGKDPGVNTVAILFPKSKNAWLIFMNGDNDMKIVEKLLTERLYLGNELWNRR